MILWNPRRIQIERAYMAREFPQFMFYQYRDTAYFQGWHTTSYGHLYQLKLLLPERYPDQIPELYVTYPFPLRRYDGMPIPGISHDFHTIGNRSDGVKICHFNDASWDASKTCVGVFCKGIIWLECHSQHLVTGGTIAEILNRLERRLK